MFNIRRIVFPPTQLHSPQTKDHRTNIPLYPLTNCSSPWERNPKVIPVYLLASQGSAIRQPSFLMRSLSLCALFSCVLSFPLRSLSLCAPIPLGSFLSTVVYGPLPPIRGPGLHYNFKKKSQDHEPLFHTKMPTRIAELRKRPSMKEKLSPTIPPLRYLRGPPCTIP